MHKNVTLFIFYIIFNLFIFFFRCLFYQHVKSFIVRSQHTHTHSHTAIQLLINAINFFIANALFSVVFQWQHLFLINRYSFMQNFLRISANIMRLCARFDSIVVFFSGQEENQTIFLDFRFFLLIYASNLNLLRKVLGKEHPGMYFFMRKLSEFGDKFCKF